MSIFVKLDGNGEIGMVHYMPFDPTYGMMKTQEELLLEGALVDSIPEAQFVAGKNAVMKYDKATNTVYYSYVDAPFQPPTTEEQLKRYKTN